MHGAFGAAQPLGNHSLSKPLLDIEVFQRLLGQKGDTTLLRLFAWRANRYTMLTQVIRYRISGAAKTLGYHMDRKPLIDVEVLKDLPCEGRSDCHSAPIYTCGLAAYERK